MTCGFFRPGLNSPAELTRHSSHCLKLTHSNGAKLLTVQSGRPGLHLISIHQMSSPEPGSTHMITVYYSIYQHQKDKRLSWPSWSPCSGRFTHISGYLTAAGQAQKFVSKRPTFYHCATHKPSDTKVVT